CQTTRKRTSRATLPSTEVLRFLIGRLPWLRWPSLGRGIGFDELVAVELVERWRLGHDAFADIELAHRVQACRVDTAEHRLIGVDVLHVEAQGLLQRGFLAGVGRYGAGEGGGGGLRVLNDVAHAL